MVVSPSLPGSSTSYFRVQMERVAVHMHKTMVDAVRPQNKGCYQGKHLSQSFGGECPQAVARAGYTYSVKRSKSATIECEFIHLGKFYGVLKYGGSSGSLLPALDSCRLRDFF
jgi:hypothetical protein